MVVRAHLMAVVKGAGLALAGVGFIAVMSLLLGARFEWSDLWMVRRSSVGWSAITVIAAGVLEELVFRGPLFSWLRRRWNDAAAVGICAVVFSAAHLMNPGVSALAAANVAIAGVLLGILRIRTASLGGAIGFHVMWNVAVAAVVGAVSGMGSTGWWATLDTSMMDPSLLWLVSGPFGVEQGLVTTVALLGIIVVIAGWIRPSRPSRALRAVIIACGLLVLPTALPAQWIMMRSDADSLVQRGIQHVYNVEFTEAEAIFSEVQRRYPEHPASYFMDAMVDWWRITLNKRSYRHDDVFRTKIDRVLAVCDTLLARDEQDVVALFFKGGALGFRGRYHAVRGAYLDAVNDGKDGLEILQQCQKIAPSNHDIMLGTGLYNYFAVVMPEKYPLLNPAMLFLPKGDRTLGLLQLKAAANQARYAEVEAKSILVSAYFTFERDAQRAYPYALELATRFPRNPEFQRALGRCLVRLGRLDTMEVLWRSVLLNYMDKQPGYDEYAAREALYYIGLGRMRAREYELAIKYFYKSTQASKVVDDETSGFTVKANLNIARSYDALNNRPMAVKFYKYVLTLDDIDGSHAEAETALKSPPR